MNGFRKLLVAGAALFIAALAGVLIAVPYLRPQPFGQASGFCALLVVAFGGRQIWKWPGWQFLVLPISGLCVLPAFVVANHFGNFDILSVVHHLRFGGGGDLAQKRLAKR